MDKNYYDILQINRNASPEIIEKAYKTLAKKYHPDLQEATDKKEAEEILKEINKAYETLSDSAKKELYDEYLSNLDKTTNISEEDYNNLYEENKKLKKQLNLLKENIKNIQQATNYNQTTNTNINSGYEYGKNKEELEYLEQIQQARQQAYHDAYIQDLKNRGYKIKYKKNMKDYIKQFIALILTILVLTILCNIPFINNYFSRLYKENEILQSVLKIFQK